MSIRSDEQNIIAARNREVATLKAEVSKLTKALHAIQVHQVSMGGDFAKRGAVYQIANTALGEQA